jgi:hypothetical protein
VKSFLTLAALFLVAWLAYTRIVERSPDQSVPSTASDSADAREFLSAEPQSQFACDGRTRCSQMTSCAEAEFFLQHCPGVEMDGNNDGEPCESQWCGNSR